MAYIDISFKDGVFQDNSKGTDDELDYILYKIFESRAKTDIGEYMGFCIRENPVINNTNSLRAVLNDDKTVDIKDEGYEIDSLLSLYCNKRVKEIGVYDLFAFKGAILCFEFGARVLH